MQRKIQLENSSFSEQFGTMQVKLLSERKSPTFSLGCYSGIRNPLFPEEWGSYWLVRISSEENRRVLAKLRNWFTAGIKSNDIALLSVILEVRPSLPFYFFSIVLLHRIRAHLQVIKKMNLDGRTMAGIKMGKALILLMKKDEPSISHHCRSILTGSIESAIDVIVQDGLWSLWYLNLLELTN